MSEAAYLSKVDRFIEPFLFKNGYELIKSEFVSEDNNWYLRLYIDLSRDELEKRKKERLADIIPEDAGNELEKDEALEELKAGLDDAHTDEAVDEAVDKAGTNDGQNEFEPGVDLKDCAKVSRYLSKWLDKEDFIKETYTLEVCSRGFLNDPDNEGV